MRAASNPKYSSSGDLRSSMKNWHPLFSLVLALLLSACSLGQVGEELEGVPGGYTFSEGDTAYAQDFRAAAGYLQRGNLVEAEAMYRELIEREPGNANAHIGLGSSLILQSRYQEAIAAYTAALEISPDSAEAFVGLGSTLSKKEQYSQAVSAYTKALSIDGEHAQAHWGLALVLDRMGRTGEALAHLERVIELTPGTDLAENAEDLKREIQASLE
jgi:tetratricopeptide (TPR) repeat protein